MKRKYTNIMIFVLLLFSNSMQANFTVSKSHSTLKMILVDSDSFCHLFIINSGFDQVTHFTSVEKDQDFYNYKYHIGIPFFIKIEKDVCKNFFKTKLVKNSITPCFIYKKLGLEKAEVVRVDYDNKINFSLKKENKCYKLTSSTEEAVILTKIEACAFHELTRNSDPFDFIIKVTNKKVNFQIDDIYMQVLFLFSDIKTTRESFNRYSRIIFTRENFLDIKDMLIVSFYDGENSVLTQEINPKEFIQKLKKIKKSIKANLFK